MKSIKIPTVRVKTVERTVSKLSIPQSLPSPWTPISHTALQRSMIKKAGIVPEVYSLPVMPPRVMPKDMPTLAMDDAIAETNAWAAEQVYAGAFFNGTTFLGFAYLSELAQRPEYRRVSEVLATAATRKWIRFTSTATDDEVKAGKIAELETELKRLDVRGALCRSSELDGFFGRSHLYLDTGATDDREELITPIGNGRDAVTKAKFAGKKGFLKAVKPIEAIWCYPAKYNANDPLKPDWYNPQSWFVQGKEIHVSRLLTFVGREVPDLLKPTYAFGGLSLSQMCKPYVDNWLRTRQAVADLIWSFSVRGIKADLSTLMAADGDEFFKRMALFANVQNNQGLMMLDKDKEDFFNIQTSLASLDALQAQAQEQMCSVSGTPVIELLGIQPAGLNASSEGEIAVWDDHVSSYQNKFMRPKLNIIIDFAMLSLWGEIDEDIVYDFEPLRSSTESERATIRKTEADTDTIYIDAGVLSPQEVRARIAADPNSPYDGLGEAEKLPSLDLETMASGSEQEFLDREDRNREPLGEEDRRDGGTRLPIVGRNNRQEPTVRTRTSGRER